VSGPTADQAAGPVTVEATGETVGEAKWKALRELERLTPSLDKAAVRFQVLSEGERGLLGVGYTPARVLASVAASAVPAGGEPEEPVHESEAAARVRAVLTHITTALGLRCRIEIVEDESGLTASCSGGELGLLIGKHGATIDAVQVLATAIAARGADERINVVVDAAGYRDRRRRTLEAVAVRSAEEALREGRRVELEPMSAAERRLVHERLKDYEGVVTVSEGEEPNRYVVVELA
jgi:spoIIIJ-associated protein